MSMRIRRIFFSFFFLRQDRTAEPATERARFWLHLRSPPPQSPRYAWVLVCFGGRNFRLCLGADGNKTHTADKAFLYGTKAIIKRLSRDRTWEVKNAHLRGAWARIDQSDTNDSVVEDVSGLSYSATNSLKVTNQFFFCFGTNRGFNVS